MNDNRNIISRWSTSTTNGCLPNGLLASSATLRLRRCPTGRRIRRDWLSRFLEEFRRGTASAQFDDIQAAEWPPMRELLEDLSRDRALQGFSPSETAIFVFSLKEPLFALLRREFGDNADRLASETWITSRLIDELGLYTIECFAKTREEVITRQQQELLELSTPGGRAVGRHPGAAADRHARQCAHADRDGEPAASASSPLARRSPSSTSPACRRSIRWWRST